MTRIVIKIACVFTVAILLIGCSRRDAIKELVDAKFDAMNRHDVDALARLYSDSATIESTNWEGAIVGATQVRETYRRYFKSSPDLKYTVTHVIEGTDGATVEYTSEGTLEQNEQGVPAFMRGKHYVLKNICRMDIRDGKIVAEATYFDQVSFLRQMGFFDSRK